MCEHSVVTQARFPPSTAAHTVVVDTLAPFDNRWATAFSRPWNAAAASAGHSISALLDDGASSTTIAFEPAFADSVEADERCRVAPAWSNMSMMSHAPVLAALDSGHGPPTVGADSDACGEGYRLAL